MTKNEECVEGLPVTALEDWLKCGKDFTIKIGISDRTKPDVIHYLEQRNVNYIG